MTSSPIRWPSEFDPSRAPIHVRNDVVTTATPDVVWAWLVPATAWPGWYSNAHAVRIEGGGEELFQGSAFRWWTFGVPLKSTVQEFVPPQRIAWTAGGPGVWAYHTWLISPVPAGTHVLTEETQYGWVARLGNALQPRRMSNGHQVWLESLRRQAERGVPSPAKWT